MNYEISILIPTKNRQHKLGNLIKNILDMAEIKTRIEFCFFVDSDDLPTLNVLNELKKIYNIKIKTDINVIFSDMWNKCFEVSSGEILLICGDDVEFKTPKWDIIVDAEFNAVQDKILYLAANDCIHGEGLGVHGFLHRSWVNTVGYVTPSIFIYNWADVWVDEISRIVHRRKYRDDLIIKHKHWITGEIPIDEIYSKNADKYNANRLEVDNLFSCDESKNLRLAAAQKLNKFIENYK